MTVLLVAGSPSEHSRSAALLDAAQQRLRLRGVAVERLQIRDLNAQALLLADASHPTLARAVTQVARARAIVVATPVYKAAYSGVLKVFLDLLAQTAFKNKHVLPLATGGSPNHMLAVDYALRPVLQSLGAHHILSGIYATDARWWCYRRAATSSMPIFLHAWTKASTPLLPKRWAKCRR